MPKVKDVLAQIGDDPLLATLRARGYYIVKEEGNESAFERELVTTLEAHDFFVLGPRDGNHRLETEANERGYYLIDRDETDFDDGFHLYRNKNTEGFRRWLRELFWNTAGRIV